MRITFQKVAELREAMEEHADAWGVTQEQNNSFYHGVFRKSADSPGEPVEIPLEFHRFYLKLTGSKAGDADVKGLLLQAGQSENPLDYRPPTEDYEPQNQGKRIMRSQLLESLDRISRPTKTAFERLESLRRGAPETELRQAVCQAFKSLDRERRRPEVDPIGAVLADPEERFYWDSMCRILSGARVAGEQAELLKALRSMKGLDPSATLWGRAVPGPGVHGCL
jgi:hypothetical protein